MSREERGAGNTNGVGLDGRFAVTPTQFFNHVSRSDVAVLIAHPGGIGFVPFVYGKKQERWPQLAAGLLFMVYSYFATSLVSLVASGAVIGVILWYAIRFGL